MATKITTEIFFDTTYRAAVADKHEADAERRRAEAKKVGISDPRYGYLMMLVGFHTIQSNLWRKAARHPY